MTLELLYPEVCNLFGDLFNMEYLRRCLPEASLRQTGLTQAPLFLQEDVALVCMAPMTEHSQELVIRRLLPHRNRIAELIKSGTVFLFTGNAMEVLYRYIETAEGRKIPGLDLLPCYAKQNPMHRINSVFLGEFRGEPITGFKTQFTQAYPDPGAQQFMTRLKGMGMNEHCDFEGFHVHNFFGTYLTGPLLILNPPFTQYLLGLLGQPPTPLPFQEAVTAAYRERLEDYRQKIHK